VVEDRDEAPLGTPPAEPQDAAPDISAAVDEVPGAIPANQVTVWMYPICRRIDALGAALGAGAIIGTVVSTCFDYLWGATALIWSVIGSTALTVYLYFAFRSGWVDVSAGRLKVQDTLTLQEHTFMRGEISSVALRDGRMSISGGEGYPRWRRLRPRQERKLREQLERYSWIEPGDV
jgi:hypothetical protein